jgi:hypothetical protein
VFPLSIVVRCPLSRFRGVCNSLTLELFTSGDVMFQFQRHGGPELRASGIHHQRTNTY